MKLALATYFTKNWTYSVNSWLDHVQAATIGRSGRLIVSTDNSQECLESARKIKDRMPDWEFIHIATDVGKDDQTAYKEEAQKIIMTIQGKAFSAARDWGADLFWSVESDILVPPSGLRVLQQVLEFDDGYYDVGMITYPNGMFLGGRGTPQNPICKDVYEDEKRIPASLRARARKAEKERQTIQSPQESKINEWKKIHDEIEACPPVGNVFLLQSKKWRPRGWMDYAYPGIGRGAILPTDWVGLGCTLLSKKALMLATYEGYTLQGTQDLFLCWKKWKPNDIRMCVVPHVLCSHVKREVVDGKRTDKIMVHFAEHELTGECQGHLRWHPIPYQMA